MAGLAELWIFVLVEKGEVLADPLIHNKHSSINVCWVIIYCLEECVTVSLSYIQEKVSSCSLFCGALWMKPRCCQHHSNCALQ